MNPLEFFPYEPREGQESLIKSIQREVREGRHVCIHAPTGFGKTPVILAALLPFVEHDGAIVWAVRTGNETDRPIEELKTINERLGTEFMGLSYRGKRDMCLLARDMELDGLGYDEVSFICKSKVDEGECEYHSNFSSFSARDFLKPMLYSEILSECEQQGICPYLVQRELMPFAHVAAMSYNYILSEGMGWSIKRVLPFKRSFLVVDEAHNLQGACSSLNSSRITMGTVERALREIELFRSERVRDIGDFILLLRSKLLKVLDKREGEETQLDAEEFLSDLAGDEGMGAMRERFDSILRYGDEVRRLRLREGKRPSSSLHALGGFWLASLESLGIDGVVFIASGEKGNLNLELWDMRASEILKDKWGEFRGCVFCSGTLEPIPAFAETMGLERYTGKSSPSFYDPRRVKAVVLKGLSTRGKELSKTMAGLYVAAIEQFVEELDSNLAIFCSSYRVQADLLGAGLKRVVEGANKRFFSEVQGMGGDESRRMLDGFKRCSSAGRKGVLCASASGRFAEGVDFPGVELEAIFLVGIPFERMTVRTQLYLDYYGRLYGKQKGRYYAYVVPALKRASQALGRALRSKEDRAFLVCGDERFAEKRFFCLLPDFVRESCEVIGARQLSGKVKAWRADTSTH